MAMFTSTLIIVFCCKVQSVFGQKAPKYLQKNTYIWTQQLIVNRIINMTVEILNDVTKKIKHAQKVRDMHKTSITFELGTISAGIQERFQKMLKIYRRFANMKTLADQIYTTQQHLHAYHVIQGDYNEIRLEKSLFHEIKKRHESTVATAAFDYKKAAFDKANPAALDMKGGKKGSKNRRKWSAPIDDHFYNLPALDKNK